MNAPSPAVATPATVHSELVDRHYAVTRRRTRLIALWCAFGLTPAAVGWTEATMTPDPWSTVLLAAGFVWPAAGFILVVLDVRRRRRALALEYGLTGRLDRPRGPADRLRAAGAAVLIIGLGLYSAWFADGAYDAVNNVPGRDGRQYRVDVVSCGSELLWWDCEILVDGRPWGAVDAVFDDADRGDPLMVVWTADGTWSRLDREPPGAGARPASVALIVATCLLLAAGAGALLFRTSRRRPSIVDVRRVVVAAPWDKAAAAALRAALAKPDFGARPVELRHPDPADDVPHEAVPLGLFPPNGMRFASNEHVGAMALGFVAACGLAAWVAPAAFGAGTESALSLVLWLAAVVALPAWSFGRLMETIGEAKPHTEEFWLAGDRLYARLRDGLRVAELHHRHVRVAAWWRRVELHVVFPDLAGVWSLRLSIPVARRADRDLRLLAGVLERSPHAYARADARLIREAVGYAGEDVVAGGARSDSGVPATSSRLQWRVPSAVLLWSAAAGVLVLGLLATRALGGGWLGSAPVFVAIAGMAALLRLAKRAASGEWRIGPD